MNPPLVTIVTPSYQQGHFIKATIESVLSQDYPRIEYIVMDGGSTDSTAQIVEPYRDRLLFIAEKDRGQTHAINKGFQMAKGEVVAYLNSDDTLLPGAVSKAVACLERNPEVGAVYGDGYQIDYDGNIKQKFPFTEPFNLWKLTFVMDYILQQSVFFRRSALEECGWLNENLHFGMDWDILVRLGKRFGLAYLPEELGCLREYDAAKSFAGGERRFKELAAIVREHTGERYPPGWWFYGLDTYDKIWSAHLRRWIPGPLGRYIATRFVHLCRARIDHAQHHSQGTYADGWASRTVHWMLPGRHAKARIRGTVPEWAKPLEGQQLKVFLNGELALKRSPGLGPFELELNCTPRADGQATLLRIEASHAVSPQSLGTGPDRRRLAWQVGAIEGI